MKKIRILVLCVSMAVLAAGCRNGAADSGETETTAGESSLHASKSTVTLTEGKYSKEKLDDTWDEKEAVEILCEGKTAVAEGEGVRTENGIVTISQEGTYVLTGTLDDGQLIVDVENKGDVKLIFNGISLTSTSTAPVYIKEGNVVITLAPDTENTVTDGKEYLYEEGEDEPKAAIFAKDDLTFNGTGSLTVNGNYNNGIQCKDDLKFVTGTYHIIAANNGIVGKDSVSVKNGNFTIEAGNDGIKSTNIDETDKGYILIEGGAFTITAGADGIQAETLLRINNGEFDIVTGGGSQEAVQHTETPGGAGGGKMPAGGMDGIGQPDGRERTMPQDGEENGTPPDVNQGEAPEKPEGEDMSQMPEGEDVSQTPQDREKMQTPEDTGDTTETASTKGLKSYVDLIIAGGTFTLDVCDDGVHSNQDVIIEGGTLRIQTGDDGVHADQKLTVNGGAVDVQKSYEGLEGFEIEINGGDIKVIASDDGINAAGDSDSAAEPEQMRGGMADEDQGALLTINGGDIYVNASGDGLDANGDIYINGGNVTVHGPVSGGDGTLDFASECKITGGTFLADGSLGMIQNPSDTSTQPVIVRSLTHVAEAGTEVTLTDQNGNVLAQYTTEKEAQWFAISTAELKQGESYEFQVGGDSAEVAIEQAVMQVN